MMGNVSYADILLSAYQQKILKIKWNKTGFTVAVDENKADLISEIGKDEFIDYTFRIVRRVVDLVEGKAITDLPEEDKKAAEYIYENEPDLRNHLLVKKNSKLDSFRGMETQIISYRKEFSPEEVEVSSAIVKITTEDSEIDKSTVFELSRRDLTELIEELIELKEKLDSL